MSSSADFRSSDSFVRTNGASRRTSPVAKNTMSFQMPVLRSRMPSRNVKSHPMLISIVTLRPISPSPPLAYSIIPFVLHWRVSPGMSSGYTFTASALRAPGLAKRLTSTVWHANMPDGNATILPLSQISAR